MAGRIHPSTTPIGEVDGSFDVIVANVLAPTLIAMSADLRRLLAPAGVLVISGVLADRFDHVVDALAPLQVIDVDRLEGWAAVSLRRLREIDLRTAGERGHGAGDGGGQGAGGHGEAQRRVDVVPGRQPGAQRTAERIAGRRGVDDVDGERATWVTPSARCTDAPSAPSVTTTALRAEPEQRLRAAEQRDLVLVGHDDVAQRQQLAVERRAAGAGLSTVSAPAARPARAARRAPSAWAPPAGRARRRTAATPRPWRTHWPRDDDDRVLPGVGDPDQRPTRRRFARRTPPASMPSPASTSSSRRRRRRGRWHRRTPPAPSARRGHRLVEALAAGVLGVARADHRLAGPGQAWRAGDEVEVGAADDAHVERVGHASSGETSRSSSAGR